MGLRDRLLLAMQRSTSQLEIDEKADLAEALAALVYAVSHSTYNRRLA